MTRAFDPAYGEAWTASQTLSALSLPNSQLLIARDADQICGFAISRWVLDEEELLMIAVDPNHQGKGIATSLLEEIIANLLINNRKTLFLEVRDGNTAYNFYRNKGFNQIGRRKGYYSGNNMSYDAITMALFFET
ncbi:MAG: ribosomal protein S18-alanine N-acetyltransferase [Sphingomonadales bacterium]|nr:ribosomal protein S18-alanine N-acetyltransferase [Sphingomonadales bacterium]